MTREHPSLSDAVAFLAGVCDYAATEDGQGFNGFDAPFGHDMAARAESTWTPKMSRAVWSMVRKYKKQLKNAGIDFDRIPEPPDPATLPAPTPRPASAPAAGRTITKEGANFRVTFSYDKGLVEEIKALQGRKFDGATKSWTVRATPAGGELLARWVAEKGFKIDDASKVELPALAQAGAALKAEQETAVEASQATDAELPEIPGLGGTLMGFQRAGVAYARRKHRCLIADEMGLGKTVQALATLQAINVLDGIATFPALIVPPANLKRNWAREARKWLPGKRIAIVDGRPPHGWEHADIVICNYDLLRHEKRKNKKDPVVLKPVALMMQRRGFKSLIPDEFHYAKNHKAQRTVALNEIAKGIPIIIGLTGTPVLNRPSEMTTPLKILRRLDDLGGFWGFLADCGLERGKYGLSAKQESTQERNLRLIKTHEKLRRVCMIRRRKADVLKDLPPKTRTTMTLEISNRPEYERAENNLIEWLRGTRGAEAAARASRAEQLARIEALTGLAARGKIAAATQWIADFLESDEKLVVFAHHIDVQDALAAAFPGCARIQGGEEKQNDADKLRFQEDPNCRLIVCSLKAGGVGHTLTAASNVAFVEIGWTPADMDQCEDRCHRIGQHDNVTAWYLLAQDTIEEEKAELIDNKRGVVDAITDGAEHVLTEKILDGLTKKLLERAA